MRKIWWSILLVLFREKYIILKTAVGDDEEPQDIDAERFEAIEGFIDW